MIWLEGHWVRSLILLGLLAAVVAVQLVRRRARLAAARRRPFRLRSRTILTLVSRRQRKLTYRRPEDG